ncbi:MAG: hypothetical protein GF383_05350 [Candidatus Lokiarchaeota archaeon]|nr:hypothetical protein [Candidatus Lokiarchaeota archaeon]MBD3339319.1 hypothetical protein [Candidatus Lokiarchaeota archaeon]
MVMLQTYSLVEITISVNDQRQKFSVMIQEGMRIVEVIENINAEILKIFKEKVVFEPSPDMEKEILEKKIKDLPVEGPPLEFKSSDMKITIKRNSFMSEMETVKVQPKDSQEITRNEAEEQIYQLKIMLKDIRPPIWRRILISSQATFHELHLAIQEYFKWYNYHLHEFIIKKSRSPYSATRILGLTPDGEIPDDLFPDFTSSYDYREDEVRLCDVFSSEQKKVDYLYDFGDHWEHSIRLEKVFPFKEGFKGPKCVGGKRAAPPEDSGGSWGYEDILQVLHNPAHPDYEEILEWCGDRTDPEDMGISLVKMSPKKIEEEYGPSVQF